MISRTGSLQSRIVRGLAYWGIGVCVCASAHESDPVISAWQVNEMGTTGKVLTFSRAAASDTGTYAVTYNDESKAATETLPFVLTVSSSGLLPAASKSALLVGFLLFTVLGVLAVFVGDSLVREKRE